MRNAGRVEGEMQELQREAEQIAWEKQNTDRELADLTAKVRGLPPIVLVPSVYVMALIVIW